MSKTYSISFEGLAPGVHHFDFKVDDSLFEEFGGSGIKGGSADVSVDFTRGASVCKAEVKISGSVITECDRCLEDCTLPVSYRGHFMVRFSEESMEDDGDVMWLNPADTSIDLARYIYESIVLSMPYRRVHPSDVHGKPLCNPSMLERFRIVSESEFEDIASRAVRNADGDSQWSKLEELKKNMDLSDKPSAEPDKKSGLCRGGKGSMNMKD